MNAESEEQLGAGRQKDHMLLKLIGENKVIEYIAALPDSTRYCYISFSGAHYKLNIISIDHPEETVAEDSIPRIAELVSYIDCESGNVPNIQVDGYRTAATDGVPLTGSMEIDFHSKSLPTARPSP
ncbi:MAG: hypothetical protein J6X33_05105 [Clostridiales bacterium]|nr:hypothetical protein [Clostridiales bacterium]